MVFESHPQLQLSMPSLLGCLMSTGESLGVNGHTTQCISPISMVESHTCFQLVPKSMTFDDLEGSLCTLFQNTCAMVLYCC